MGMGQEMISMGIELILWGWECDYMGKKKIAGRGLKMRKRGGFGKVGLMGCEKTPPLCQNKKIPRP